MSTETDRQTRIQSLLAQLQAEEPALHDEIQAIRLRREVTLEGAKSHHSSPLMSLETIVMTRGRPVLRVFNDEPQLSFDDSPGEFWRDRLIAARAPLAKAIRAVGRIELTNHPNFSWVGTGWLVAPDVVVTNRHVATEFGRRRGDHFVFRQGFLGPIGATVDFLSEFGSAEANEKSEKLVSAILHIEDEDGPDIAFLRVEATGSSRLPLPIDLSTDPLEVGREVALIGYPTRDSRVLDQEVMMQIFGDVFDKKCLAPGTITDASSDSVQHDCSSLGGASGSVLLDLESGKAVGLHFAGAYLSANYAVAASRVRDVLSRLPGR